MKIHLHIERLVLEGWPVTRREGAMIQAAVEAELARLIATEGLPAGAGGAVPSRAGAGMEWTRGASPREVGREIARSIHRGFHEPAAAIPANGGTVK